MLHSEGWSDDVSASCFGSRTAFRAMIDTLVIANASRRLLLLRDELALARDVMQIAESRAEGGADEAGAASARALREHLRSSATVIRILHLALSLAVVLFWLVLAFAYLQPYAIPARVDVYASLEAPARQLMLATGASGEYGAGLRQITESFAEVVRLNRLMALYQMLNGFALGVFVVRIVQLADFQPRLGIVTRTLANAASDLGHLGVMLCIIFFGCCALVHFVFGGVAEEFNTFGRSMKVRGVGRASPQRYTSTVVTDSNSLAPRLSPLSLTQSLFNLFVFGDDSISETFYNMPDPLQYPGLIFFYTFSLIMTVMVRLWAMQRFRQLQF